ncbi:MAG: MBL fold metallo-hydrolase [Lachnospiraceae bacterium]|nr:MBL fold metallo-hydrolase [Lachnospiraceae bacterium]MDD3616475.1 MBL fold metallo-hydrolase [Lachnospiraceae bacterium]
MKITYIEHSSFLIELENCYLLFDYYQGKMPVMNHEKRIYAFASHVHHDHFSFDLFEQLKEYKNVKYILSRDIRRKFNQRFFEKQGVDSALYEKIVFLNAHESYVDNQVAVETLMSTDEGVAFLIEAEGHTIYHAGDLNWWSWDGENDKDAARREKIYKAEITHLADKHFEVAFLPLDPRQEERFFWGFDWFMQHVDVDTVYPMHMWEDYSVIEKLRAMPESITYRKKIQSVGSTDVKM